MFSMIIFINFYLNNFSLTYPIFILQSNYDNLYKHMNNYVVQLKKDKKDIQQATVLKERLKKNIKDNNILQRIIKKNGMD